MKTCDMRRKYSFAHWLVILVSAMAMALTSCSRHDAYSEEFPDDRKEQLEGDWVPLEFSFESSEMLTPQTRALSEIGENQINQSKTRMLVFAEDGKFVYEAKITSITPTVENQSEGQVKLLAKDSGGTKHTFVMLVNVDSSVKVNSGDLISNVLKEFTFKTDGTWSDGTLPMWGEVTAVVNHTESSVPQLGTIHLIRAVARVDIGLNLTKDGTTQFNEKANGIEGVTLTSAHLYNTKQRGLVAPEKSNWDATNRKALQTSLPTNITNIEPIDKSKYIQDDKLLLREIYLPEAANDNSTTTDYLTRPYIIVGLTVNNKETFYRIDYLKKNGDEPDATYEYLPLLRNNRYLVNITGVGGPGFDSTKDAQKGPAANIMYDVEMWDESQMTNVQYDGQYMLAVNPDKLTFYKDGGELTSTIQTSFPNGFSIEGLPEWITHEIKPADPTKTGKTDEKIVTFIAQPTDAERTFTKAYVKAGRMKWNLHFEQKNEVKLEIGIFSDPECTKPIDFIEVNQYGDAYDVNNPEKSVKPEGGNTLTAEEAQATVTFYVKGNPTDIKPEFKAKAVDGFVITEVASLSDGVWKYTVTHPDLTANQVKFESEVGAYYFTISKEGNSASAQLNLIQREYNAIPYYEKEMVTSLYEKLPKFYVMDGKTVPFFLQANTEYTIEYLHSTIGQSTDIGEDLVDVGEKNPLVKKEFSLAGEELHFKTIDDLTKPQYYSGKAYFKISSPKGLFPPREFYINLVSAIKQPEANTYMMKAGSKQGILIPLSRINTARAYYDRLLDADEIASQSITNLKPLPGLSKDPYRLEPLTDDDQCTVEIVWSDIDGKVDTSTRIDGMTGATPTEKAGLSLLKILDSQTGKASDDFILVRAGSQPGNVSIALRSGRGAKEILWSWHIWILKEYPSLINIPAVISDGITGVSSRIMSHIIGATTKVTSNYQFVSSEAGLQYQWGRKDPFPTAEYMRRKPFFDRDHKSFNFIWYQLGTGTDFGREIAMEARGSTLTLKESIQRPHVIVAHQSFWQFELFPHRNTQYFAYKSTFRFLWDNPGDGVDLMKYRELDQFGALGLKTVFDPSPYGFRIMSFTEATSIKMAYYKNVNGEFPNPITQTVYDGNYLGQQNVSKYILFAIRFPWVAPKTDLAHAGRQLVNTEGANTGWTTGSAGSLWGRVLRRCVTFSVRPVRDTEEAPTDDDYTKYLPK